MTQSPQSAPTAEARRTAPVRQVVVFVALAYALAWAVFAPALLSGAGPDDAAFAVSTQIYVFTPALAALIVVFVVWRPARRARALGLVPLRPVRRLVGYSLLALVLFLALGFVAALAAGAVGVIRLDLVDFSGIRAELADRSPSAAEGMSPTGFPAATYVQTLAVLVASALPFALLMNLGEELGWRGYLLPRLLPWGVWPAMLISGLIHALWHSPQLAIHIAAGTFGPADVALFIGFTTLAGVLFGWFRLASGSVWPAVVAHAANNVLNITGFFTLSAAGTPTDPLLYPGGLGGLVGLAVVAAVIGVLAATRQLRVRDFDRAPG